MNLEQSLATSADASFFLTRSMTRPYHCDNRANLDNWEMALFCLFTRCARYATKIRVDDSMGQSFVSLGMPRGHPQGPSAIAWAQSAHGEPSFGP